VICEIMNDDGSMARRPELEHFAAEHGLKMGTIADLIHYRIHNERTVEPVEAIPVRTAFGELTLHLFHDRIQGAHHLALVKGREPSAALPAPREVQAALVDAGHLPADLAARLSHARELTAPPAEDEDVDPLSAQAAATLITSVNDLLELGRQRLVEEGL
jgi:hypothetical protein